MHQYSYALISVAVLLGACSHAAPKMAAQASDGIAGTWRLVEFWDRTPSTAPFVYRFGRTPCGYIVYTPTGHMSAQIAATPIARNLPADSIRDGFPIEAREALDMLRRHVSYFGTYRVDSARSVVIHRVEGDVKRLYTGRNEERPFRLRGDSLVIGNDSTFRRVFVRERGPAALNPGCVAR